MVSSMGRLSLRVEACVGLEKVKRYWILLKTKAKNWPFALKMLTLLAQVGTTNAAGVVLVPSSREKHPSRYASTIEPAATGFR